ncbi:PRC-barrel domain-containing protein [Siccirubricoccus sp. KC 17139]|uniref:PRC-barrel domain-containing protein n=1 Tax=Siccirubricoccus soli TaxID=2899147 RepID=A0ABT1DAI3_9PROT|nr:PRC-barrel domain-containing protein [Siccirubricoccus soli]MCO6418199.1 PRC-barrel domain-containing protein [Siccirubricoccus soli]MCP2684334.1 PRC-barrel domain-containing protein [Siccirubricoccus soli]
MTQRQSLLAMTAAAALLALPVFAQQGGSATGGSSMQPQTTQNAPDSRGGPNSTTPRDASGGVLAQQRDGTPGNPPSTATQRGTDSVTGDRTPPDGTPGNPPGTAAGRATDRALGTNMSGAHPENDRNRASTGASTGAGAATGTMAVDSAAARNGRRASKVIGANVYNENNESIGEVDDIIIPPGGGAPVAVLSVGGFLGIGAKLVAVPYDRLQMGGNNNRWTLSGATKESLTGLPTFTYDQPNERRG